MYSKCSIFYALQSLGVNFPPPPRAAKIGQKEGGGILESPLKKVIYNHWSDILVSIFINSTGSVIFYLQAIYLMSFLRVNRDFIETDISNLANYCYLIMALITLGAGYLSDRIGRKQVFIVNLIWPIDSGIILN